MEQHDVSQHVQHQAGRANVRACRVRVRSVRVEIRQQRADEQWLRRSVRDYVDRFLPDQKRTIVFDRDFIFYFFITFDIYARVGLSFVHFRRPPREWLA